MVMIIAKLLLKKRLNVNNNYEALLRSYNREKKARELAEDLLEQKTSFLYKMNMQLNEQYTISTQKNMSFEYLNKISKLDNSLHSPLEMLKMYIDITIKLIWADQSYCFELLDDWNVINAVSLDGGDIDHNNLEIIREKINSLPSNQDETHYLINDESSYLFKTVYFFPSKIVNKKYIFIFAYNKDYKITDSTIELMHNGINLMSSFILRYETHHQMIENYNKLKEMKSQLIQSDKMASLGTISAGIAHEINNPLSFLLTNMEVLKNYSNDIFSFINEKCNDKILENDNMKFIMSDLPELLNESLIGIERIKDIVQGLRTFSRADDGILKEININSCIDVSLKLVSNELKHKSKIMNECKASKTNILGSQGQLIQVFTNLLLNSSHAIGDNGEIIVGNYNQNNNVICYVKDNGKGISKENINKLFTPFFTTKGAGQGTGLGLSISYGIVQKHKGKIWVESEENKGTTFFISIPLNKS